MKAEPSTFRQRDLPEEVERVVHRVIGAAMEVHTHLGPGLLEGVYERALMRELELCGLKAQRQVELLVPYKGVEIPGQRLDLVVEDVVILELKVAEAIHPIHRAQLFSYLRSSGHPVGLVINFNTLRLRDGVCRVLNERSSLVSSSRASRPSR